MTIFDSSSNQGKLLGDVLEIASEGKEHMDFDLDLKVSDKEMMVFCEATGEYKTMVMKRGACRKWTTMVG